MCLDSDEAEVTDMNCVIYIDNASLMHLVAVKLKMMEDEMTEMLYKEILIFICLKCYKECGVLDAWPEGGTTMACPSCGTTLTLVPIDELERQEEYRTDLCNSLRMLIDLWKQADMLTR